MTDVLFVCCFAFVHPAFHALASPRIYTSTNPYKKLCPLEPITSNKTELLQLVEALRAPVAASVLDGYAATIAIGGPAAKKAKTARTQEEKGKAQEIEMAKWIEEEHLPRIEKEEQVSPQCRRPVDRRRGDLLDHAPHRKRYADVSSSFAFPLHIASGTCKEEGRAKRHRDRPSRHPHITDAEIDKTTELHQRRHRRLRVSRDRIFFCRDADIPC